MTCSRPQRNVHRRGIEPGTPWSEIRRPIHCATPSRYTKKTTYGYTSVYAIVLKWPENNTLTLGAPTPSSSTTVVTLLGYNGTFSWKPAGSQGMNITVPPIAENMMPCKWAWIFKLEGLVQKPRNLKHPVYFPDFEMYGPKPYSETYKSRHSPKKPQITVDFN